MANDGGRSLTKGEQRLLVAVVVFVGMVLGVLSWWNQRNLAPDVAIPTPVMPKPNAHDLLLTADQQLQHTIVMHRPAGTPINKTAKQDSSGKVPTTLSLSGLNTYLVVTDAGKPNTDLPFDPTPAEMRALVRANAPGFAAVRQALQSAYVGTPVRSFDDISRDIITFVEMARKIWAAGRLKSIDGAWSAAMDDYVTIIHLGETIPHGGALYSMMCGNSMQFIGRKSAWKIVSHLDAVQASANAKRLAAITATHVPFADTLREEKWTLTASLLEEFREPHWRVDFLEHSNMPNQSPANIVQVFLVSKREVVAHLMGDMDALIANAQLPYAAQKAPSHIPADPISAELYPHWDLVRWEDVYSATQNALLEVTLALHAYQLDHGNYPATLTALVPGYLHTIPDDPFALKGLLRYRLKGQQYVLYSIGPDGKDDGGVASKDGLMPIPAPKIPPGKSGWLGEHSTGDIVAGVNIR